MCLNTVFWSSFLPVSFTFEALITTTKSPIKEILAKHPDRVIEKAVFGMLPKNSLAKQKMRTKLKVFAGAEHTHAAQMPQPYVIGRKAAKVSA